MSQSSDDDDAVWSPMYDEYKKIMNVIDTEIFNEFNKIDRTFNVKRDTDQTGNVQTKSNKFKNVSHTVEESSSKQKKNKVHKPKTDKQDNKIRKLKIDTEDDKKKTCLLKIYRPNATRTCLSKNITNDVQPSNANEAPSKKESNTDKDKPDVKKRPTKTDKSPMFDEYKRFMNLIDTEIYNEFNEINRTFNVKLPKNNDTDQSGKPQKKSNKFKNVSHTEKSSSTKQKKNKVHKSKTDKQDTKIRKLKIDTEDDKKKTCLLKIYGPTATRTSNSNATNKASSKKESNTDEDKSDVKKILSKTDEQPKITKLRRSLRIASKSTSIKTISEK